MATVHCYHPAVIGPLSPERRSWTATRCCAGPVQQCGPAGLAGVYPGSNGMALAGYQGHYYRGTPPHPPTLYYILFLVTVVTLLAWLPVVVMTRLLQRRPSQLLLCQLRS